MNNIRIAKELVRVAKELTAGSYDETISAGSYNGTITAGKYDKNVESGQYIEGYSFDKTTIKANIKEKIEKFSSHIVSKMTFGYSESILNGKTDLEADKRFLFKFSYSYKGVANNNFNFNFTIKMSDNITPNVIFEDESTITVKNASDVYDAFKKFMRHINKLAENIFTDCSNSAEEKINSEN